MRTPVPASKVGPAIMASSRSPDFAQRKKTGSAELGGFRGVFVDGQWRCRPGYHREGDTPTCTLEPHLRTRSYVGRGDHWECDWGFQKIASSCMRRSNHRHMRTSRPRGMSGFVLSGGRAKGGSVFVGGWWWACRGLETDTVTDAAGARIAHLLPGNEPTLLCLIGPHFPCDPNALM